MSQDTIRPTVTPLPGTVGRTYWRCRSDQHTWMERADAERCCDPAFTRALVPRGQAVGMKHSPSAIDGFVFVWLPVSR